ncbi:MAG TPA: hypothetical protein VK993_12770 [Chthoniobacterales bacterium]|nr:hypothetical protein [Chthoniobacterales bacterium]
MNRARYASLIALAISAATVSARADDCQPTIVLSDATGDSNSQQLAQDIESVSIEEPYAAAGAEKIVFRIKVASLESLPSVSHWEIHFKFAGQVSGAPQYVKMQTNAASAGVGRASFLFTGPNGQRDAEPESNYAADGTITIVVAKDKLLPGLVPGRELTEISASTYTNAGVLPSAGGDFAGGNGSYTINGNCELEPPTVRLANIAGRSVVRQGDNVGIGGFIVAGPTAKRVIVRGIGTSLKSGDSPLPGRLSDPTIELRAGSGELLGENDNWRTSAQAQEIRESGLAPREDREAAVIATLEPGIYTAILRGANQTEGIGVVEIYDTQVTSQSELANLASRAFVSKGDDVLIGGFIVNGGPSGGVLLRAIGPSLAGTVPDELRDPTIEVINAEGVKVGENDNWRDGRNAAQIQASGAAPNDDRESAVIVPVTAGPYTATVRGKNGTTGNGVVEIYRTD